MVLKLYDPVSRRRAQKRSQILAIAGIVFLVGLVLFAVFRLGAESVKANEGEKKREIAELRESKTQLEQEVVELRANAMTLDKRYQELERQYTTDIGSEELRKLVLILRERLNAGIKAERLAAILSTAENIRKCSAPETKRFILKTALSRGPASTTSFAGGAITVTGEGEPATNPSGAKESWFDPGKTVTLIFKAGEAESRAAGILPLHHSIIQGNTEHRFTISKGARSFIEISADQCAYP